METDTSKSQYEQTANDEELVEEDIDPRILKLLGLEDVFDFEYGEYKTLIREKLTELDMKAAQKQKKPNKKTSENQALLIDEFKRVKRSKGKFKLKSKAVKAEKVVNKSKASKSKPITNASKLLPGSGGAIQPYRKIKAEIPEQEQEEQKVGESKEDLSNFFKKLLDSLKGIGSVVNDLVGILNKQLGMDKKNAENRRREGEKAKAKQEEKDLEKQEKDTGSGILEKITKPFTSIFDTIRNFLLNVLLGSIVMWLLKVIKNPMILLKPIQGLVDGIVGFFNTVIQFIDNMVVQPVRNFINTINSALKGFIDILNGALKMLPGSPQVQAPQVPNIPEPPEIQSPDITGEKKQQQQAPSGPPIQLKFTGGQVTPMKASQKKQLTFDDKVSREGGDVSSETTSYDVGGLGPDKHLTALSTGEYVLKKGAADWLGGPAYLDGLNKLFGGSSERRVASIGDVKIQAANEGGSIGNVSFDPDVYAKTITKQSSNINVGSGASSKRYAVSYARQGSSGTFVVKQINKIVQGAGLGMLIGGRDQLTGVKPSSDEGKLVVNSVSLRQHFEGQTGKIAGPVKIQVDPQADIYWAYKQAYNTTYEKWMKQGAPPATAREYARRAAADFAVARKGASQLPGSKEGLDVALKQVDVPGGSSSYSSSSSAAPSSTAGISDFAANYKVLGDPARAGYVPPGSKKDESKKESGTLAKSILGDKSGAGNPPGALAPGQRPDKALNSEQFKAANAARAEADKLGLTGTAKDKFVAEKVMAVGTSSAMIMPPDKPKQSIPQPPSNKPTIAALPLPAKNQTPMMTGSSNGGSKSQTVFSSFREDEATLAVVASIYNMWGGL
jgi:hypothetical protein